MTVTKHRAGCLRGFNRNVDPLHVFHRLLRDFEWGRPLQFKALTHRLPVAAVDFGLMPKPYFAA